MSSILADKSVLIVEDYSTMRKAIRDMLYTLDAEQVSEADNGANALAAMSKTQFDVILCDYNLGPGRNGQQVLEEARHRKLIAYHCLFFIIAAEQSAAMVLGAMDAKPDEYIAKPFNAQQLFVRLERNLLRKAALRNVEKEIERGDLSQAILNCDQLLTEDNPRMRSHLYKLRAELALQVEDYDKAAEIYQHQLLQRDLPWARLGMGIVAYQRGHVADAIEIFQHLLQDNPLFMEGYDWLSKALEAERDLSAVQSVLSKAVELSPQSILRQKKLAGTADKNGDFSIAESAYKAALSLSKYSVHKSSADFSNLAKLYCKTQATDQAQHILSQMRHEFPNDSEAELRAAVLEVELNKSSGNDEAAAASLQQVLQLSRQLGNNLPQELQLEVVRSCYQFGEAQQADCLVGELIKTHIDDDAFIDDIRTLQNQVGVGGNSEDLIQKTKRALVRANNKGVSLYRQGKFDDALALFEQAMTSMPDNKTIVLNMLKIVIHDLKANGPDHDKLVRAKSLLRKAKQIRIDDGKLKVMRNEFAGLLRQQAQTRKP